ncbi:MAG: hypothetical protein H7Z16_17325 [Pyrinomonadaceae bacterium]|nr:hypothetical protein [Pyrinomonadaceae bacterium]
MNDRDQLRRNVNQSRTRRPIDQHAIRIPQSSGLLPCLYIPVAARDTNAIETYVGRVLEPLAQRSPDKALLVESHEPDEPDARLTIWGHPGAAILHHPKQVWVHVDYSAYRRAYIRAFPDIDLSGFVLDHIMNRRVARLKGFNYLRIVPISRQANSSHGGLSEGWAVEYHSTPRMIELNKASEAVVQYADLSDVVKMLNMEGGGSFMQNVNDAQKLVDLPDRWSPLLRQPHTVFFSLISDSTAIPGRNPMQKLQITRLVIAGVPLISLFSLVLIFGYVARDYVRCKDGKCEAIGQNIGRVLMADDPKARELVPGEPVWDAKKKAIANSQRTASIYGGRLTFILIAITNLLTCTMAGGIACFVLIRSLAHTTIHPIRWLVLAIAVSITVGLTHYYVPDSLAIVGPVFTETTFHDVPTITELLKRLTSFGYAVIFLLSLAVCTILFLGNASSTPDELKRLSIRMKHLQLILYVSTLMLVAAALLMRTVAQWSLAFIPPEGQKAAATLFSGLMTIEAGLLTLVLAAVYLPAAFILQTRAESLPDLPETEPEREKVLQNYDLAFSLPQSLPRIAAILGPVLVGPIGEMVSRLG